jgi:5-formyltetrahydrofolate cyclo-ligase
MEADALEAKAALRKTIRTALEKISPAMRVSATALLSGRLKEQAIWRNASSVLLFAPLSGEPDIWPLLSDSLAAGKITTLPRFDSATNRYIVCQVKNPSGDISTGRFGIREPTELCSIVPLNRLDFILVPGVAFDLYGRRLGRGKGFYDQLLADVRGVTCGVAFDEQIVTEIPVEPHDVRLHCILTPTRWIEP